MTIARERSDIQSLTTNTSSQPYWIRYDALVLSVIAFAVVAFRSWLIARAHSATFDTEYHISNGLGLLQRTYLGDAQLDNPPSGSALMALPVFILRRFGIQLTLDGWLQVIAVWKSLLAMPIFTIGYIWAKEIYGRGAGLLALCLLLIEPTLSAHIVYATVDTIIVAAIAMQLYLFWRYVQNPTNARFLIAAIATAVSLAVKQNAVFAVAAQATIALVWWWFRPRISELTAQEQAKIPSPTTIAKHLIWSLLVAFLVIWALLLFRVDPFVKHVPDSLRRLPFSNLIAKSWPAGLYIRSIMDMCIHTKRGHCSFLLGKSGMHGWWYYFPVLLTYKIPLAMGLLFLLAIVWRRRLMWTEVPLLICTFWFVGMCLISTINIGFRHALPGMFVFIIFASRCWTSWRRPTGVLVALITLVALLDVSRFYPNYLSYINFHRDKVWLDVSDSNIDWGQGLKQARAWAEQHHQGQKPVSILYSCWGVLSPTLDESATVQSVAGPALRVLKWDQTSLPTSGILIVSPLAISRQYLNQPLVPQLWNQEPLAIIGDSLLVYDLDAIEASGVKLW